MKLLFDFDGVLTNQTEEALRVREIFLGLVSKASRLSQREVEPIFDSVEAAMLSSPERHGWSFRNRVTAFANEDLFIRNNGLAACLDQWAYEGRSAIREVQLAIRAAGHESFQALAQLAYTEMVRETGAGKMEPMDPKSSALMQRLLDLGHEAVVVSNSGTDRILNLFRGAGIAAEAHSENPKARLRVRGGARKFELGEFPRTFEVGGYRVDTARPVYEAILREELPQAAVGDVFSLDLALPLHLARTEPLKFGGIHLFLRTQDYTPSWSKEFCQNAREGNAKLRLLTDLDELVSFLEKQS